MMNAAAIKIQSRSAVRAEFSCKWGNVNFLGKQTKLELIISTKLTLLNKKNFISCVY